MAGSITGLGTSYNLPNYTGILHRLTPVDTPFFSAIGGLSNGGGQTHDYEFEWQSYDLRNPNQNVALEGQDAPTKQERVRANHSNILQIHQEAVGVSYTKQAATQRLSGLNNDASNPITSELDWQTQVMLQQMVRDIEFSFLMGVYNKPSDNTTKRKTRGILTAITTNLSDHSTSTVTGLSAATDTVTETATTLANGDKIIFTDNGGSATLVQGKTYYVVQKATNSFKVSETSGGSAVTIGTATVSYRKPWTTTLTPDHVEDVIQAAYDGGGVDNSEATTIMVNSTQKRKLTAAYASAYGKFQELSRNVGGVNLQTIETNFGVLNIMLNRYMPQDALAVISLDACSPVYLEVPGKGHFFAEDLSKTGAHDSRQLYGEVGLKYGHEKQHALVTGLAV